MRTNFLLALLFFSFNSWSKIDPPNYDFSLQSLEDFAPGKTLAEITSKIGQGETIRKEGSLITKKYSIEHLRYKFPVVVNFSQDKVADMYAVLPSYFLHDVFHQSIINRYGKQDEFKNLNGTSVYIWKNKNNLKIIYSATCTITCFPLYFSLVGLEASSGASFTPMIESLSSGHF